MSATTSQVVAVLRAAAEHVETVGLYKGDFFESMRATAGAPLAQRACCAMGAVSYASGYWAPTPTELFAAPSGQNLPWAQANAIYDVDAEATRALRHQIVRTTGARFDSIPAWSDAPSTTAADVAAMLRAAADYEESQQ